MTRNVENVVVTNLTPEAAQRLLAQNTFNRPLRAKRIARLAKAIADRRWKFNGFALDVPYVSVVLK